MLTTGITWGGRTLFRRTNGPNGKRVCSGDEPEQRLHASDGNWRQLAVRWFGRAEHRSIGRISTFSVGRWSRKPTDKA
jgi:hypothetical protein